MYLQTVKHRCFVCSFHVVYTGNGQCHKVSRLSELTSYHFRIRASNDAGDGVFSPVCTFHTSRAPPVATRGRTYLLCYFTGNISSNAY